MAETKTKVKKERKPRAEKAPRPAAATQPAAEPAIPRAMLRTIVGVVSSDKGNKSITVIVDFQTKHPKYGKILRRRTKLYAHDEKNEARPGDKVELAECRPLSKTKHHRLIRIIEKAPEQAVQVSAEEIMTGKAPEAR